MSSPIIVGSRAGATRGRRRVSISRIGSSAARAALQTGIGLAAVAAVMAGVAWQADWPAAAQVALACAASVSLGWVGAASISRRRLGTSARVVTDAMALFASYDMEAVDQAIADQLDGGPGRMPAIRARAVLVPMHASIAPIAEALNQSISVLQRSADRLNRAPGQACRRLFFCGPDEYVLGCLAGEFVSKMLVGGGDVLLMTPGYQHAGMDLRRRGFVSTLAERNERARVIGTLENMEDPAVTYELVSEFLTTHPRLQAIYSTEAIGMVGAVKALRDANREGPVLVCHDLAKGTAELVRSGSIAAAIWQDPFGQGYDVAVHLFNAVAFGWRPKRARIMSASAVVTADDFDRYWRSDEGGGVDRLEPLAQPLGVSTRPIRIAVLGSLFSDFWKPVGDGTRAAAVVLANYNATVELILPDGTGEQDSRVTGAAVERLVAAGYDAIATFLIDWQLVPYLNDAVDHGVLVATYNSEIADLHSSVATLSDERERLEGLAHELADSTRRDPLTGIRNRVGMDEELVRAFASRSDTPIAIVMLDIDHFKRYNDTYGHAGGDEVLRKVAQRIQVTLRPHDMVYRVGGEEFLVLVRGARTAEAVSIAGRLVRAVQELAIPHSGNPGRHVITISAGVAEPRPDDATVGDAISRSDGALYQAKRSGRNKVVS